MYIQLHVFDFLRAWVLIGRVFTVMAETSMFIKCSKLAGLNFHNLSSLVFIYAVPLITSIVLSFGGLRWAIVTAFKLWHIYGLCWKWPLIVRKFPSFPTDKNIQHPYGSQITQYLYRVCGWCILLTPLSYHLAHTPASETRGTQTHVLNLYTRTVPQHRNLNPKGLTHPTSPTTNVSFSFSFIKT